MTVNGRRPASVQQTGGKLHIAWRAAARRGGHDDRRALRRNPAAHPNLWGEVGFEELTERRARRRTTQRRRVVVPVRRPPSSKASYRIQISTDSPYRAVANGELVSRRARAGHDDVDVRAGRADVDLSGHAADRQVRDAPAGRRRRCRCTPCCPNGCARNFDHDFGRQPQMMKLFVKLFGPYPLSTGYTVVVTDDDLEIPLEAQGISIFGANHCDGTARRRAADRARTGAPVVRQLGDRPALARHLAARGLRLLRGMAVVGGVRRPQRRRVGAALPPAARRSPQDLLLADPGRATCSTTASTSAAR